MDDNPFVGLRGELDYKLLESNRWRLDGVLGMEIYHYRDDAFGDDPFDSIPLPGGEIPLTDRTTAEKLLNLIELRTAEGLSLESAIARFRPRSTANRVDRKVEEWSRDARYEGRLFDAEDFDRFFGWFTDARDSIVNLLKENGIAAPPVVEPVFPESP